MKKNAIRVNRKRTGMIALSERVVKGLKENIETVFDEWNRILANIVEEE